MPALNRAKVAVESLEAKDINEMKANRNPMDIIRYIFDAIAILFQNKIDPIKMVEKQFNKKEERKVFFTDECFENTGKFVLNDMNLLKKLLFFEKDSITEETIELLEPYIAQ